MLTLAQKEGRLFNHHHIGTEHLLLGILCEEEGIGGQVLKSMGIKLDAVREVVEKKLGRGTGSVSFSPPFTTRAKKVLEFSLREALQLGHSYVGTEHMLLGLVREGEGAAATILVELGVDLATVRQNVIEHLVRGSVSGERAASGATKVAVALGRVTEATQAFTLATMRQREAANSINNAFAELRTEINNERDGSNISAKALADLVKRLALAEAVCEAMDKRVPGPGVAHGSWELMIRVGANGMNALDAWRASKEKNDGE